MQWIAYGSLVVGIVAVVWMTVEYYRLERAHRRLQAAYDAKNTEARIWRTCAYENGYGHTRVWRRPD